jgi:hypothetical protein
MGSMESCSHDFSSILPSEETFDPDEPRTFPGAVSLDGDEIVEICEPDLVHEQVFDENLDLLEHRPFENADTVTEKFRNQIVVGNVWSAASILVKQAAFQTKVVPAEMLPVANVMLFLHLARLVMSSGLTQHHCLSKLLLILHPFADSTEKNWAPLPCTVLGFRSRFLNVSNSNSLVSILPIPIPDTWVHTTAEHSLNMSS